MELRRAEENGRDILYLGEGGCMFESKHVTQYKLKLKYKITGKNYAIIKNISYV